MNNKNPHDRNSVTAEIAGRIKKAGIEYISDFTVSFASLARIYGVSESTMQNDLMINSLFVDQELHTLIVRRDLEKWRYLTNLYGQCLSIANIAKLTGIPKSTVHEYLTKHCAKFEAMDREEKEMESSRRISK